MAYSPKNEILQSTYPEAVGKLLNEFSNNSWFINSYWPENRPRINEIVEIALTQFQNPIGKKVLEVGCANGYVAYLFRLIGFEVSAIDAYQDQKRSELFQKNNIFYHESNLNSASPLSEIPDGVFDLVLLGEVFEHILNNPSGLLKSIFRILRPGGMLILTTPNPSTIANAIRLIQDRYLLWGTPEFIREIKIDNGSIIDRGDIHYREYPGWVICDLIKEHGFVLDGFKYVRFGSAPTHSLIKRIIKKIIRLIRIDRLRLFSPGYILWCQKPSS
jgi:SAM-dependent methyltransferase